MVEVGDIAPDFCLPMAADREFCLKDREKGWLVLYFYPKDNTSGCTREAVDFTLHQPDFRRARCRGGGNQPGQSRQPREVRRQARPGGEALERSGPSGHRGLWGLGPEEDVRQRELWGYKVHLPDRPGGKDSLHLETGQGGRPRECGNSKRLQKLQGKKD